MAGWDDIGIGAGKGALAGASTGAACGGWVGAIVGGVIGAVAGGVGGKVEGDAKEEMVVKQDQAAEAQGQANETAARRQAAAMLAQAAADRNNTSATMFTKAKLQREANTNYADIRDKAEPFTAVEKKQFYGNKAA